MAEFPPPRIGRALKRDLARIAGPDRLLTDPADCWPYGSDASRREALPQAVIFARDAAQVAELVGLCARAGLPLVARGRGTGLAGGAVPERGGIVLSFERMDRILEIAPADRLAVVEPGVLNLDLQQAVAAHGHFWPPDPSSAAACTVGGNLACNAAGPRAVKYGTARDNTLGLAAVTGRGEILSTGVRTTKGVVGYDLTRILIGCEGTLALIVAATLKLTPLPEARTVLRAAYRDMGAAAAAVASLMAGPVTPAALEIMDAAALAAVRAHAPVDLPADARALLTIEADGPADCIAALAARLEAAARHPGLIELRRAADTAEAEALQRARRALGPALRRLAPRRINEDVVVPVSRLADLVVGLERLALETAVPIVNFGHAGNGNLHVNLLVDPADPARAAQARDCLERVFDLVLDLGGTLSGEHGVGLTKRDFVAREIDAPSLALMADLKARFDPAGILNPGKALPLRPAG